MAGKRGFFLLFLPTELHAATGEGRQLSNSTKSKKIPLISVLLCVACLAGKERNRLGDSYARFGAFYIEARGRYWKKTAAVLATSNVSPPRRHFGGLSKKLCRDN